MWRRPRWRGGAAVAIAIAGGRIVAVGAGSDLMPLAGPDTDILDCGGRAIMPGLVDAHCHLFAAAAAQNGVDCRPAATPDAAAVVKALRTAAAQGDGWVRGYGYDDSPIGLARHLNRCDLDAVSTVRPVRVEHRSGHACVLNTAGLAAAGIGRDTPAPPGGVIVRDAAGEPTGLLLEMSGWLRPRTNATAGAGDLPASLRRFGQRMLSYGITAATDAGPDNGVARWQSFGDAIAHGLLPLRVTMLAGIGRLPELADAGLRYGAARVRWDAAPRPRQDNADRIRRRPASAPGGTGRYGERRAPRRLPRRHSRRSARRHRCRRADVGRHSPARRTPSH